MDAQRQALVDTLGGLNRRAADLFRLHPAEALLRKPSPRSWSIAQCVDHMETSLRLYLPGLTAVLSGRGPKGDGPYTYGRVARGWIRLVGPGGPKLPSPRSMRPRGPGDEPEGDSHPDPDTLLADFKRGNDGLAALIHASVGLDLARIRMRSPVIPLLYLPVGAWFETCVGHSLRHMDQAEQVAARLPR
jgi:hypothetical protein